MNMTAEWDVLLIGDAEGAISAVHPDTGDLLWRSDFHAWPILHIAISRELPIALSIAGDGSACQWDIQSGRRLGAIQGADRSVSSACFLLDGNCLAVGDRSGLVIIHSASTMREYARWQAHDGKVSALVCGPNRLLYSGGQDGRILAWLPEAPAPAGSAVGA
jgi:WD40 repeat protein